MGRRSIVAAGAPSRDPEQIAAEIAALRALPVAELRHRWRTLGGDALPRTLPVFLVLRLLACKLQAKHFGDLAPDLRKALLRRGRGEKIALPIPGAGRGALRTLAVGTLLTREWAGHVQHVIVLADGFAWNGQTFGSLSEVARAITGTRWSGPTFFGLKGKANPGNAIPTKDRPGMALHEIGAGIAIVRPVERLRAGFEVGGAR